MKTFGADRWAWWAATALAFGTGCSQAVVSEDSRPSPPITSTAIAVVSEPSASAAPSATTTTEARSEPAFPKRPRTGAPGSTKNTIACGETRCDASRHDCEWVVETEQWACVPETVPVANELLDHPFLVHCDDASDCAAGERCCAHIDNLSKLAQRCAPRTDVDGCRQERCYDGGAACPPGTECQPRPTEDDPAGLQGTCVPPRGTATCTGRTKCPAERPVCVASDAGATCERMDSKRFTSAPIDALLTCTLQSDCNGEELCMYGWGETRRLGTFCGRWSPGLSGTLVCDPQGKKTRRGTAAELARECGANEVCREKFVCKPGEYLPWLGMLVRE